MRSTELMGAIRDEFMLNTPELFDKPSLHHCMELCVRSGFKEGLELIPDGFYKDDSNRYRRSGFGKSLLQTATGTEFGKSLLQTATGTDVTTADTQGGAADGVQFSGLMELCRRQHDGSEDPGHYSCDEVNRLANRFIARGLSPARPYSHAASPPSDPCDVIQDSPLLLKAAEIGCTKLIRLLLDAGANLESGHPSTPLIKACEFGHLDAVKALVDAGANFEVCEKRYGGNVLHAVARIPMATSSFLPERDQRVCELMEFLLSKCPEMIERCDSNRCTPLAVALDHGRDDLANILLAAGANTDGVLPAAG
ncbi:hypothetical protein HDU96_000873, partial [Phlyctochytrium bullatum]